MINENEITTEETELSPPNTATDRELRRSRDLLRVVGTGVIAFGVWSFVKTMLFFGVHPEFLITDREIKPGDPMYLLSMFFLAILLILDLSFRFFIGMEARKESRGGKAWPGYIVLAGILGVMLSLYILLDVKNLFADMSSLLDNIAALLVDLTSAVNLFQLVAAARRVRRLTGEGGETCR